MTPARIQALVGFRMGHYGHLGRPFESLPTIAKSTVARVPTSYKENTKLATGSEQNNTGCGRKEIVSLCPYPGIGKHGFEWIGHNTAWETV
jgi:hypothetical protein